MAFGELSPFMVGGLDRGDEAISIDDHSSGTMSQ